MSDASLHFTGSELKKFLEEHPKDLVLIDFYADWCPHCQKFGPVLESVARSYRSKGVHVIKIDTDAEERAARDWAVEVLPTWVVVRDGEELARVTGSAPQSEVEKLLKQYL